MRLARNLLIALVALVVAWVSLARFGYLVRSGVGAELEAKARAGPSPKFRLSELTDFEWERVVFLGPYTSQQQADRALGFHWPEYSTYGLFSLEVSDTFNMVVFTAAGRVVYAQKTSRCLPDFSQAILAVGISKDEAEFSIQGSGDCLALVRDVKRSN